MSIFLVYAAGITMVVVWPNKWWKIIMSTHWRRTSTNTKMYDVMLQ